MYESLAAGSDRPVRRRALALALSLGGHVALALAFLLSAPVPLIVEEPAAVTVSLVPAPSPVPAPTPAPVAAPPAPKAATRPPSPAPKAQAAPVRQARQTPSPLARPVAAATATARAEAPARPELTDGQIALASTAESGGGGGGGGRECNMVAWLQTQLRQDAGVHAKVNEAWRRAGSRTRALQVWDGDWLRSTGEEGEGLAGLREAIMVEVAFAPAACRNDPVRGLVLISMSDAPGAPRLAIGGGSWRWPDLLQPSWRR